MKTKQNMMCGIVAVLTLAFAALSLTACEQPIDTTTGGGDTTAPALSEGSVSRASDTAATIGFTSSEAGTAYYLAQNADGAPPAKEAVKAGTSLGAAAAGANSGKAVTLTAGAKDIYVVVEDAAGNISVPLKIEAAAYDPDSSDPECECNGVAEDCECEDCNCDACDPTVTLIGITAEYTQTAAVYPNTPRDDLKNDLTVTANYSDDTSPTLNAGDYTLGGTLAEGESVITVTYQGKSDDFTVTVTAIITAIEGVTAPAPGGTPAAAITETAQYTGTVAWQSALNKNGKFKGGTAYTATITLTAKDGFTFNGLAANFFTVAEAEAANAANSGVITAVFPATEADYIITGSGSVFTATRGGVTVGTANQSIANTLTAIRTDASGEDIVIQFGDGENGLDIGTATANFANSGGDTWGTITLWGKITSGNASANDGTVGIGDNVSVISYADIANTDNSNGNGRAVVKAGNGTVTISGGTVKAAGRAVDNNGSGTVTISGGTVSSTGNNAVYNVTDGAVNISGGAVTSPSRTVYNNGGGAVTISGGTVSSTNNTAVYNNSDGLITISGTAFLTSASTSTDRGTIALSNAEPTSTKTRLVISGGTVQNTSTANGRAVYNASAGGVTISGGTVSAAGGVSVDNSSTGTLTISGNAAVSATTDTAVANNVTGTVNISGGTVSATTGSAIQNALAGTVTISGGTVSATDGRAIYNMGTGLITLSGSAAITSARTASNSGTIHLRTANGSDPVLVINDQVTVTNTNANSSDIGNSRVVYKANSSAVVQDNR